MQIGNISFCEKNAINIKTDKIKKQCLDKLQSIYNVNILSKHYYLYNEHTIEKLQNHPYITSLKSDGNPYLLFLTRLNNVNTCIMIDKKIQQGYFLPRMIIIHLQFTDNLFDDTIFDGEMIKDNNNNWVFIINDLYALSGQHTNEQNVIKRINQVYQILQTQFVVNEDDLFNVQVKKYFKCDDIEDMIEIFKQTVPYSSRGVIFKPMFLRFKDILYNFNNSLINYKVRTKVGNTNEFIEINHKKDENIQANVPSSYIDINEFNIKKTDIPDVYELHDSENKLVGNACVNKMQVSKFLSDLFENSNINSKFKVKCVYNSKFKKWTPIEKCQ